MVLQILSIHSNPAVLNLNTDVFGQGKIRISRGWQKTRNIVHDDVDEPLGLVDIGKSVRYDVTNGSVARGLSKPDDQRGNQRSTHLAKLPFLSSSTVSPRKGGMISRTISISGVVSSCWIRALVSVDAIASIKSNIIISKTRLV
jgi:hypothetical protein